MERRITVFGTGGHALVVADAIGAAGSSILRFVDDRPREGMLCGVPVETITSLTFAAGCPFIVAIGDNATRAAKFELLMSLGAVAETIIHPRSTISSGANLGAGTVALAGSIVNAGASVGRNTILNTACSIDHECEIGEHVHVAPGVRLAGKVTVGTQAMIGIGSCVIPGITIGARSIIGAGAVVVRNIPEDVVAVGNPARVIRRRRRHDETGGLSAP